MWRSPSIVACRCPTEAFWYTRNWSSNSCRKSRSSRHCRFSCRFVNNHQILFGDGFDRVLALHLYSSFLVRCVLDYATIALEWTFPYKHHLANHAISAHWLRWWHHAGSNAIRTITLYHWVHLCQIRASVANLTSFGCNCVDIGGASNEDTCIL
jgi:hypothetical protein